MKGKKHNSRLFRSLSMILAVLMVVSSVNVSMLNVSAEEIIDSESIVTTLAEGDSVKKMESNIAQETEPAMTKDTATETVTTEDTATETAATEDTATETVATEDTATETVTTEDTATETVATEEVATEETEKTENEASVEEVITESEEVVSEESLEAVADRVIDFNEVATEYFGEDIFITKDGYCIGEYAKDNNPYIPFKNLSLTGEVDLSNTSVCVYSMPEGSVLTLDNLQIKSSAKDIFQIYSDVTINYAGTVILNSYMITDFCGNDYSGISLTPIKAYGASVITITGSGDIYYHSPLSDARPYLELKGTSSVITKDYTGNIYMDNPKTWRPILESENGENIVLETAGTITMLGNNNNELIATYNSDAKVTLSGAEVKLSLYQTIKNCNIEIISKENVNIEMMGSSSSFFLDADVSITAGKDVNFIYDDGCGSIESIINSANGIFSVKAGGSVVVYSPEEYFGKGSYDSKQFYSGSLFQVHTLNIEAGKDFICKMNAGLFTGQIANIDVNGNIELEGYYPDTTGNIPGVMTVFDEGKTNIKAKKSIKMKGDYASFIGGMSDNTITTGEDFIYEGGVDDYFVNANSCAIQTGGKIVINNNKTSVSGHLFAGHNISLDAAKDICINSAVCGIGFAGASFNIKSGASVQIECYDKTGNTTTGDLFDGVSLKIDAKDKISIKAPACNYLFITSTVDLTAKGDISLDNYASLGGGISKGVLNVTKAKKLDMKAPVRDKCILEKASIDIPGDVTITGLYEYVGTDVPVLKIKNANDVTIELKAAKSECVVINECNIKGNLSITNTTGEAVKFADNLVLVANTVEITGKATSTLTNGKNITIKAEKVGLKNNANGFVISDVLQTESEVAVLGFKDSENQDTGTGFYDDEIKKASFVSLSSEEVVALASLKSGHNQVASLDDIDVVVLFDGKEVSGDLYTLELGAQAPYEKVDVIAKNTVDSEDGVYLLGQIELYIAANNVNVASVSVGNKTKNFTNIEVALAYADGISTEDTPANVTLLTPCLIINTPYMIKGNIILNLDGLGLAGSNNGGPILGVEKQAKLVIIDEGNKGSIGMIHNQDNGCGISTDGTLTINGGVFYGGFPSGYSIKISETAKVEINGGSIQGLYISKDAYQMNDITITGGHFAAMNDSTYSISCNAPVSYLFRSEYGPVEGGSSNNWIDLGEGKNTKNSFDVVAGRTDINTISDKFGFLSKIYYDSTTQNMVEGYHTGIDDNLVAGTDYTIETPLDYEALDNGFKKKKYVVRGIGKYYGEIVFDYYVVPVPTTVPESSYSVSNSISSTNDIELPEGFKWKEEVSLDEVGTTPNTAYTVYYLDVFSYEDEFDEHEVNIYRSECAHISSDIIYDGIPYEDPTCTTAGYGYYKCLRCNEILGKVNVPAFGHKAKYIVDWKTLGVSSAEVLVNAYCESCGASLLTDITVKGGESNGSTISLTSNKKSDGGVEWTLKYQNYTESRTVYASGYVVTLDSSSYEYTGTPVKPQPTVYYGDTELVAGKDYTVTYANNTKANRSPLGDVIKQSYDKKTKTSTELVPTITIKGKGNYSGTATASFDIIQRSIKEADVTLLGQGEARTEFLAPAKGKSITLFKTISYAGKKLTNKEYEAKVYASSDYIAYGIDAPEVSLKDIPNGEYVLVVSGKTNYSGDQITIFNVSNVKYYLANAKVTLDKKNKVKAIKIGSKTFALDNFIIEYPSDTYAVTVGEHHITITPDLTKLGNEFAPDSLKVKYTVAPTPIKASWFSVDKSALTYNGEYQYKQVNLTAAGTTAGLTQDVDYKVVQNNINAGNATVTIVGINNYSGKININYKINARAITDSYSVTCDSEVPYNKIGAKATNLVVNDPNSKVLTEGKDYKVSYRNNTKLGTATVVITGIGNYSKSTTGSFTVTGTSIDADNIAVSASDLIFKKDGAYKGAVTVTDNGKKLGKNEFAVTYEEKAYDVQGEDLVSTGYIILEATVTGRGNYASTDINGKPVEVKVYYRVATDNISSLRIKVDSTNAEYAEGSEVRPVVTVEYGVRVGLKTIYYKVDSSQYTLTYSNNKSVGTGKVTVTGTKKYLGSKTVTYKIKQHKISF